MTKKLIIAIDGPAASGKGSVTKALATKLNFSYLSTGNIYRIAAKFILSVEVDFNDCNLVEEAIDNVDFFKLDQSNLVIEEIGYVASVIALYPNIRKILANYIKTHISNSSESIIVEGRDIGSVICPEANFKFFLTATAEARAMRRFNELQNNKIKAIYSDILKDLIARDNRDLTRNIAPLIKVEDAIEIDSSNMSINQVVDFCFKIITT